MIPKIIHYCWLSGDPFPESIQRCIDSWKRVLPDYEIMLWDTKRFDLSSSEWVRQAFESKKYAFAADYIRMYALYNYGGIYLDSDVEVLKPFDDLLDLPYFIGKEKTPSGVEAATLGGEKGWPLAKLMLDRYDRKSFKGKDGHLDLRSLPYLLRWCIESNYEYRPIENKSQFVLDKSVINVFPEDYFSPKDWNDSKITVTPNTYSIHHFASSWMSNTSKKRSKATLIKEKIALLYRRLGSMACKDVAVLSNRPLAGQYYRFFFQERCAPLLNTKVYSGDFVRLMDLFKQDESLELSFIPQFESKHSASSYDFYPVARIGDTDIEVHFIHCLRREDARKEWERGLEKMKGKRKVVAFVALTEEDEEFYSKVTLPKFKLTNKDRGLENMNQNNCDSYYFWKRMAVMKDIRKRIRKALRTYGKKL